MILAAATLSDWLGLVGAALSAIGVLLTLIGTKTLRSWLTRGRSVQAIVGVEPVQAKAYFPQGRVKVGPPDGVFTVEWLAEDHQRQIDALAQTLDVHGHPKLDKTIARVETNSDKGRAELLARFEDLDREAGKAEAWNVRGLVVAGAGAALQVGAVAAAILI